MSIWLLSSSEIQDIYLPIGVGLKTNQLTIRFWQGPGDPWLDHEGGPRRGRERANGLGWLGVT